MSEKETKFCNGTFECFGCPEQGEGNCYISGCPWVARFEEIKDKFAVAWFKREHSWIVKAMPDLIETYLRTYLLSFKEIKKIYGFEKKFRMLFGGK